MTQSSVLSTQSLNDNSYKPALHRIALLTACVTFPLIFMGGLVTSHQAGMSVPDWPNSYGYNMFLFPPRLWIGGIRYEHTHRLMATIVGFCAICLSIVAWHVEIRSFLRRTITVLLGKPAPLPQRSNERRWVQWLCLSVLGAVIFQGVLGGLRVVLVQLDLAIVHACVAQAFFCLAALSAIVTSRWWINAPDLSHSDDANRGHTLIGFAIACAIAIYLQLIVGATMRHFDAGLAIPDLPYAYGKLLPPTSSQELATINAHRAYEMNLRPVTLTQIWLHFSHRIGACIVTIMILIVVSMVLFKHARQRALIRPASILLVLLLVQLTLGVLTVLLRKPADIASAHVAVGAGVLVTSFVLAVRAMRLYSPACRAVPGTESTKEPRGFEITKPAIA